MSERIDHVAEARRIITEGESAVTRISAAFNDAERDRFGKKAAGCWTQAQVHATLALVEQQRIANLLTAFNTYERWPSRGEGQSFNSVSERLGAELREGLGLT